ncbi:hypothetical protein [Streptomyces sp. NPDC050535]|uniref:ISAzo13-like element transposase-related protein n=1 Tax=Streptomyces sp. NPDC050535 TaxID=3365626 RepID=UPI0037933F3A
MPRRLAEELTRQGAAGSARIRWTTPARGGFNLQRKVKTLEVEDRQHPDRDAPFHYLNEQARNHQNSGTPVITADTGGCSATAPTLAPSRARTMPRSATHVQQQLLDDSPGFI